MPTGRLLENKDKDTQQIVEEQLIQFLYLRYIANVFSKKKSSKLLLHCESNYKITLITSNLLSTSLLYSYISDQLETIKKYLIENFYNSFIKLSNTLYRSPILFAIKGNSI